MTNDVQTIVTQDDLDALRHKFQSDLVTLREQISLLQSRAAALEAQIAKIEPMVEARASRTEKLVMELQVEFQKMNRVLVNREKVETDKFSNIESMLRTLVERSE
jgi:uncharacterized protein YfcZ (UPF0381/DUF406 family)